MALLHLDRSRDYIIAWLNHHIFIEKSGLRSTNICIIYYGTFSYTISILAGDLLVRDQNFYARLLLSLYDQWLLINCLCCKEC